VNQDHVYQRELTLPDIQYNNFSHFELISDTPLTKREKEISTLLGRGLSRKDICKLLKIKRYSLRRYISNMRKKIHGFLQG